MFVFKFYRAYLCTVIIKITDERTISNSGTHTYPAL